MRFTALLTLLLGFAAATPPASDTWHDDLERWRAERAAELASEGGWLSVAGLFWLDAGETRFGSGPEAELRLRPPAPPLAGRLRLQQGRVSLRLEPGVDAGLEPSAQAGSWRALGSDADPGPQPRLRFGPLSLQVIDRSGRIGIRLFDDEAPHRRAFQGLRWYAPATGWRIDARFVAHPEPRTLPIANVIGQTTQRESPGYVLFEIDGRELRLEPVLSLPDRERLLFIFRDATSGAGSYGAGRFLDAEAPRDGRVELDFNRAYSPPCAFTEYATCPLPPRSNWLELAVEAGERDPGVLDH